LLTGEIEKHIKLKNDKKKQIDPTRVNLSNPQSSLEIGINQWKENKEKYEAQLKKIFKLEKDSKNRIHAGKLAKLVT
jgi:hypothetical protein